MKCKECGKKFYWYHVTMEHPKIIEAANVDEANEELQRRLSFGIRKLAYVATKDMQYNEHLSYDNAIDSVSYKSFKPSCEECRK